MTCSVRKTQEAYETVSLAVQAIEESALARRDHRQRQQRSRRRPSFTTSPDHQAGKGREPSADLCTALFFRIRSDEGRIYVLRKDEQAGRWDVPEVAG
jgi:hypothetical protein